MGVVQRQVRGTGVTTGALTGACHLYICLLTQWGMLQCKRDMMTTISFSISNLPCNWQIVIFLKKIPIYDPHLASAKR